MDFLSFLISGLIAGWLAGVVMKGRGFGVFADIGIGIVGAFIGGFLFKHFGFAAYGFTANTIVAFVGALVLLAVANLFSGGKAKP